MESGSHDGIDQNHLGRAIHIDPKQVIHQFGIKSVTYFPRVSGACLHAPTANLLASVGLPAHRFFSPREELEHGALRRLDYGPSLRTHLGRDGVECPPGAERWEVIGGFLFAIVALDPESGAVYALSEGESEPLLMHADVSSLVHAFMVLERGQAEYRGTNRDDDAVRDAVVTRMRQDITTVDPTPIADDESQWSRLSRSSVSACGDDLSRPGSAPGHAGTGRGMGGPDRDHRPRGPLLRPRSAPASSATELRRQAS